MYCNVIVTSSQSAPFVGTALNLTYTVAFHTNMEIRTECSGPRTISWDRYNASCVSGSGSVYSVRLITNPLR